MEALTVEQIEACRRIGRDEEARRTTIGLAELDALCDTALLGARPLPDDLFPPEPRSVLDEAIATIEDRMKHYGSPKPSFERTAALWSAYLGVPISPRQVCLCLALLKISRDSFSPKHDNLVDIPGYARCAQLCSEGE